MKKNNIQTNIQTISKLYPKIILLRPDYQVFSIETFFYETDSMIKVELIQLSSTEDYLTRYYDFCSFFR